MHWLVAAVSGHCAQIEPLLLVTIGFGGILSNIPGVEIATGDGLLHLVYVVGIETGAFPLIIFMGVGAMTDFGPLLANPRTLFLVPRRNSVFSRRCSVLWL